MDMQSPSEWLHLWPPPTVIKLRDGNTTMYRHGAFYLKRVSPPPAHKEHERVCSLHSTPALRVRKISAYCSTTWNVRWKIRTKIHRPLLGVGGFSVDNTPRITFIDLPRPMFWWSSWESHEFPAEALCLQLAQLVFCHQALRLVSSGAHSSP